MKKAILSAAVVLSVCVSNAQQDPQYTNFMYDKLSINPGYAGMSGMYCGTVLYRSQWIGFDDAPKTMLFNADGAIPVIHGGAGLTFYNDKLGFETNNIVRGSYSWHQTLGPGNGTLGIGLAVGYMSKSFNANWNPIDPNDVYIPSNSVSEGAFDMNFGAYWRSQNQKSYAGISVTHLTAPALNFLNLDVARHFWVMGGHSMSIPQAPQWQIQGDAIIQSDFAATQVDVAVRGWYHNMVYGGIGYRHKDAISILAGYHKQLKSFPAGSQSKMFFTGGLSYDVTTSDLNQYSNGTMELFVRFCFKPFIPTVRPKPYDVRFLGT